MLMALGFPSAAVTVLLFLVTPALACGPGKFGGRRRAPLKITPLVFKEHVPNIPEFSLAAAGPPEGRLTKNDPKFLELVPNYSSDVIFQDSEGTGEDRLMTPRCKEKLDTLAISVLNQYPGLRLRVTEAYDEEGYHAQQSLHYEGRSVDVTTSDRDRAKLGMLGRLAVHAGFDFVYYESRSHIHCSVKSESADAAKSGGCFNGDSLVQSETGLKKMSELRIGEKVLSMRPDGSFHFSEVILFLDRDSNGGRMYEVIVTESGSEVIITPSHLIFAQSHNRTSDISQANATFAKNVQIGDYVYVLQSNATPGGNHTVSLERVVNITVSAQIGVYAPLTKEGNLIVNNVLVSCYAVINDQTLAHIAFWPIRVMDNFQQAVKHFFQKLHYIKFSRAPKRTLSREKDGIHWYPALLYKLTHKLLPGRFLYR